MTESPSVVKDQKSLADLLEGAEGLLLVVTGAGISVASGIPTFRGTDPDAVWKRDVTELGTLGYFHEDPVGSWRWYLSRFDKVLGAQPNAAHHALVDLESWQERRGGSFLLVTQNVDPLHEAAGSRQLVKVHGSADRARCSSDGCPLGAPAGSLPRPETEIAAFLADPRPETLPRCPRCGSLLRQHVLWFDEFYNGHRDYQWERVQEAAISSALTLFVGTSFSVGVTELFLRAGLATGIPLVSVDPGAAAPPVSGMELFQQPAEELLPAVCQTLGAAS